MSEKQSTALVVPDKRRALAPLEFTSEDMRLIRLQHCPTATDVEFEYLMKIAALRRLNPMLQQIHFVKRKANVNGKWIERWVSQVGIDGFRALAEETGRYDGQDEPEFERDDNGNLICAKVRVYKKGISRPFVGVAYFSEYAQYTDGGLTAMWRDKPHVMLAKCSEAQGFRKAFPQQLGGLYAPEELMRDIVGDATVVSTMTVPERPVLDPAPAPATPTETLKDKADRLLAVLAAADPVTRTILEQVRGEADPMPRGPDRERVLAGYLAARERAKGGNK